jgi:hypothetical protein
MPNRGGEGMKKAWVKPDVRMDDTFPCPFLEEHRKEITELKTELWIKKWQEWAKLYPDRLF